MDRQTGSSPDAEYPLETFPRHSFLHSNTSHPLEDIDVNQSGNGRELPEHGTTVVTNGHASIALTSDDENIDRRNAYSAMSRRARKGDAQRLEVDQRQQEDEPGHQGKSSSGTQAVIVQGPGESSPRAMGQASQELVTTLGDAADLGGDRETSLLDHESDVGSADVSVRHSVESVKDGRCKEDPRPRNQSNPLSL